METRTVRTKRYVRHRFGKPSFLMQPRDYEIIRTVSEHRVISSDDLQLLIPGSDQSILRRLQKLFHHGFLDRPRSQRQFANGPMVYALGQQGAELIFRESGQSWSEKNRTMGPQFLDHALMVSRFHTALSYGATNLGTVSVESWKGDGSIREAVRVEHDDRVERIPVVPDAYVVLNVSDSQGIGRVHLFLEADRSTMTLARFITKLRGYFAFWRSGKTEEKFGMKNFLVVTTTTSQSRRDHLLAACREVSDRGLRMFLFGTESDYLSANRSVVFDPIWKTPADEEVHSLLE